MRSHYLGVAVQTMVRKRLIEVVVFQPKGAPQALTLSDSVMWMGQQIPRKGVLPDFSIATCQGK